MSKFYYTFDKNGLVVFDVTKIVFMELDPVRRATVHYGGPERVTVPFPGSVNLFRMWINNDEVFDQLMKVHETAVNAK